MTTTLQVVAGTATELTEGELDRLALNRGPDVFRAAEIARTLLKQNREVSVRCFVLGYLAAVRDYQTPPHCSHHRAFEYDCLDCSDALEAQRRANGDPRQA